MNKFIRTCEWCQTEFETEWDTKVYCTRQHKEAARDYRRRGRKTKVKTIQIRTCKNCATNYTVRRDNQLYCSQECSKWYTQQLKDKRDREYQNARTPSFKRRVFFKSEGICGICHEMIDLRLKYPEPKTFSIDHIVPRANGGSHARENLQAAHLICNTKRGNSPLDRA